MMALGNSNYLKVFEDETGGDSSMKTKRNRARKLAMTVAIPGVTLGTVAGFAAGPAMASTAQPRQMAQYESFHGHGQGSLGRIFLVATGAFYDSGYYMDLNSSPDITVHLSRGNLFVYNGPGNTTGSVRPYDCTVTYRTTSAFTVYGGSARYRGVHGRGVATVTQTGALPRTRNGHCNTNAEPIPFTVRTTLVANAALYNIR
jgi:hypothetical protein